MQTWAQQLSFFYRSLQPSDTLPEGINWLHPQQHKEVRQLAERFFDKYFNDHHQRTLLLGINPGRLGAGTTGINFTAAKQLEQYCGMEHHLKSGTELSAEFIYEMIAAYGGPEQFYKNFFIGSVCPLGFVKNGKNINYYDDRQLQQAVTPFIVTQLLNLLQLPVNRKRCICIGGEKNYRFLSQLNDQHQFFREIIPMPHPRFILQYRRKQKDVYLQQYLEVLK